MHWTEEEEYLRTATLSGLKPGPWQPNPLGALTMIRCMSELFTSGAFGTL